MTLNIKYHLSLFLLSFFMQLTYIDILVAYQNFDNIPITKTGEIPADGDGWEYSSGVTNTNNNILTGGWYKKIGYSSNNTIHDSFLPHLNTNNDSHLGYSTYGYAEIDDFSISGHSLKYTITGGYKDVKGVATEFGTRILNKETYLQHPEYVDQSGETIGTPYFYFLNNSANPNVYFEKSQGANRLSIYIWLPEGVKNGDGTETFPLRTVGIGPYTGQASSHWYNSCYFEGGGWTHIQVDGHPNHNNSYSSSDKFPYPSYSMRDMGTTYFNEMYRFYLSIGTTGGIAVAPYSIWLDEIEFHYDEEPQNNETINTLTISYNSQNKVFQVGFNDKYRNNGNNRPIYELRYSFSPITNSNWVNATPALIQTDTRYPNIKLSTPGEFRKNNAYYANVWAPFKLNTADEALLTNGKTIYFAVKDVGQSIVDSQLQRATKEGRDYYNYPDTFDYAGDKIALTLIKRISFKLPASTFLSPTVAPKIIQITTQ